MPRSLSHHRRAMQTVTGPHARVHAFRNKEGALTYRIKSLPCVERGGFGHEIVGSYHSALTRWVMHMRFHFPDLQQPAYTPEPQSPEQMRAHIKEAASVAAKFRESALLEAIFGPRPWHSRQQP